jgi:hypothetical protein
MNTSNLYQTIAMNIEGAKLFTARDFAASASSFQRSASNLREFSAQQLYMEEEITSNQADKIVPSTATTSHGGLLLRFVGYNSVSDQGDAFGATDVHDHGATKCSSYYLHATPLLLSTAVVTKISDQDTVHDVLLAATCSTLFNLALAFHMEGNATGSDVPRMKAAKLYDSILAILDSQDSIGCCNNASLYAAVICLVLNNRAHLYMELEGEYTSCVKCVRHLLNVLDPVDLSIAGIGASVVNEIGLNCMRLLSLSAASAALVLRLQICLAL